MKRLLDLCSPGHSITALSFLASSKSRVLVADSSGQVSVLDVKRVMGSFVTEKKLLLDGTAPDEDDFLG